MEWIKLYLTETISLLNEMSPYLLFGFLIAGILYVYFPADKIYRYMGKNNILSVVNSSLLGVPLPLCSCGVIPTAVSFYKNGASKASTVSFLISTPQTGVDSIFVTYSMLGLPFAILRPIIAFITGIFGGILTLFFDKEKKIVNQKRPIVQQEFKKENKIKRMFKYAFVDFIQDIQKWLVIGILLAGLIAVLVPKDFFTNYVSNDFVGMLLMLIVAIPLYVCATSSVPIAAVLMMKGLSPGAALVFLMAGPATNITTITILYNVFGLRSTLSYLFSIITGALVFGLLINQFLPTEWFSFTSSMHAMHQHQHGLPVWLGIVSSIILMALLANGFYNYYKNNKITKNNLINPEGITTIYANVGGLSCNNCKISVDKNIRSLDGIKNVEIDLKTGKTIIVGTNIDNKKLKKTVEELGYTFNEEEK